MMATDTWNIRLVILGLITIVILCLVLHQTGHSDTQTDMLGQTALGALAAILATTRSTKAPDVPDEPVVEPEVAG